MATAKKLPSGSWRCLVYSHSEPVFDKAGKPVMDPKTGKQKEKRIYESFTSDNPTKEGKREAEMAALEFMDSRKRGSNNKMTLREAIDRYISESDSVLSPTTISGYEKIKKYAFQDILDMRLRDITNQTLKSAVNQEAKRTSKSNGGKGKTISPKTVSNEYGLITAVLNTYIPGIDTSVTLPAQINNMHDLLTPDVIFDVVKGSPIELPVLLAMWLSFTISEIKGLTKSKSISGDYITIVEVMVNVNGKDITKQQAKEYTRTRRHRIPPYIKGLIDQVETDQLVTLSGNGIYKRFTRMLKSRNLPHMSFHDLRHVNASVMAVLQIPEKYAQERGGWKTDTVMKKTYMQTFSQARKDVDQTIDDYFENNLFRQEETDPIGYREWLKIVGLKDNNILKKQYSNFVNQMTMQHKMQHDF